MDNFLADYELYLNQLLLSGEYDDELINELGASIVADYRIHLGGFSYPLVYLGNNEEKVAQLRMLIFKSSLRLQNNR